MEGSGGMEGSDGMKGLEEVQVVWKRFGRFGKGSGEFWRRFSRGLVKLCMREEKGQIGKRLTERKKRRF